MQYKGEDLDLRVPHGRAPRDSYAAEFEPAMANGRWSRSSPIIAGHEPVWVDEILLACCNYAFDIAQANGAAEVALEHLVNAMTRVEAASRQLENRGVREGQLRRESAALIASEVPAANAGEAVAPRRSAEIEDTLRRAADIASRRGSVTGIDDVLWALLHSNRDHPVVQLLRRLTPDWQRTEWFRLREPVVEPPPARAVQLVANDSLHSRIVGLEDSLRHMQAEIAADRKLLIDLVRDLQRDVVAQRSDGAAFRGDLGQRLETLERSVHTRIDTARVPGQIADRMAQLEKAVHSGLGEGARNWAHLGQRLAQLETAMERRDVPALDAMADRIGGLERTIQQSLADNARNHGLVGQRLSAFETLLSEGSGGRTGETIQPHLAAIERRLAATEDESKRRQTQTADRMDALFKLIEAARGEAAKIGSESAARLSAIEVFLADGPGTPDAAVRQLSERIGGVERAVRAGFGDAAATTSQIVERIAVVERGMSQPTRDDSEAFLILDERLAAIERTLDTRGQQVQGASSEIAERLALLEQRSGSGIDLSAAVAPLDQRLSSIESAGLARAETLQGNLVQITSRLDQLDERIRSESLVTEEALRGRDQDFDFIYSEIKQLGQSQATLNSAVNDWRNESHEHFGTLTTRLDKLSSFDLPAAIKPAPASIETAAPGPDTGKAGEVSAEDFELPEPPGSGFWYWLFGTSSVTRANRRSNLEVTRMRRNIRDARERRRMQA